MGAKKANLVLTDPPYNVAFESSEGLSIKNDKMDADAFYEFLLAAFTKMVGVCNKGASAYVFHADTEGLNFRRAFQDAGFTVVPFGQGFKDVSPKQGTDEACIGGSPSTWWASGPGLDGG